MHGLPDPGGSFGALSGQQVEALIVESRFGNAEAALTRLEALLPGLEHAADGDALLLGLYGRALMLGILGAPAAETLAACDLLEQAAGQHRAQAWAALAAALRAQARLDTGAVGEATSDLSRAEAELAEVDLSGPAGFLLLDAIALVCHDLRLHDRCEAIREALDPTMPARSALDQATHWSHWSYELCSRGLEPLAGGTGEPSADQLEHAARVAARIAELPPDEVPAQLARGAAGVRALAAAFRGRASEALRLLGPDAFGSAADLPPVGRRIVTLAAMRAHALVGSLATARSIDEAAASQPSRVSHLVLEISRTRERLWLETYADGDVVPILNRLTELLVRLSWRGMDLVADTARQALEHRLLRAESRTDALTGVGNRRALDEGLRELLRFSPLPLAMVLVDVDRFKEINDRFTHVVGDEVLRRVATSLSGQLRAGDRLLRYGGDEFVVLLPDTGDQEAHNVAERISASVAALPWGELADGLEVTAMTGCAALWSLTGRRTDTDAERLFRRADERLLEAKRRRGELEPEPPPPAPAPRQWVRPVPQEEPPADPTPTPGAIDLTVPESSVPRHRDPFTD